MLLLSIASAFFFFLARFRFLFVRCSFLLLPALLLLSGTLFLLFFSLFPFPTPPFLLICVGEFFPDWGALLSSAPPPTQFDDGFFFVFFSLLLRRPALVLRGVCFFGFLNANRYCVGKCWNSLSPTLTPFASDEPARLDCREATQQDLRSNRYITQ